MDFSFRRIANATLVLIALAALVWGLVTITSAIGSISIVAMVLLILACVCGIFFLLFRIFGVARDAAFFWAIVLALLTTFPIGILMMQGSSFLCSINLWPFGCGLKDNFVAGIGIWYGGATAFALPLGVVLGLYGLIKLALKKNVQ